MTAKSSVFLASSLLLLAVSVQGVAAQEAEVAGIRVRASQPLRVEEPRLEAPQWGIGALAVRTIAGLAFQESDSGMTFLYSALNLNRYRTGGSLWFDAALSDLPAGAQLVGLELEGCDTSAASHIAAILFRTDSPIGATDVIGTVSSGDGNMPGCAFFGGPVNLPAGQFVDNVNARYVVRLELPGLGEATSVGAVRVYYKLRVSPAPGVATFNDVPVSNLFFQYVEALVASGITGGCGGGNYCPDAPVTRGQMAVFLSAALGLHFPF